MPEGSNALRFLCDRMLERLGRYLRAAGYDTATAAPDMSDAGCLRAIERDGRILLSCDRELVGRAARHGKAVLLPCTGVDDAATSLASQLTIDWRRAPFSRCLIDNAELVAADCGVRSRTPPRARAIGGDIMHCPICGRIYWPGSHVRRMAARLRQWQDRPRAQV